MLEKPKKVDDLDISNLSWVEEYENVKSDRGSSEKRSNQKVEASNGDQKDQGLKEKIKQG